MCVASTSHMFNIFRTWFCIISLYALLIALQVCVSYTAKSKLMHTSVEQLGSFISNQLLIMHMKDLSQLKMISLADRSSNGSYGVK